MQLFSEKDNCVTFMAAMNHAGVFMQKQRNNANSDGIPEKWFTLPSKLQHRNYLKQLTMKGDSLSLYDFFKEIDTPLCLPENNQRKQHQVEKMECPICLGPLNRCPEGIEDNVRRRLAKIRTATCCCTPCGHIFHKACLLTWLDQSNRPPCPVCNVKLSKMKLYPAYLNVDKGREGGGGGEISGTSVGAAEGMLGTANSGRKKEAIHSTPRSGAGTSSVWTGGGSRTASSTATAVGTVLSTAPLAYPKNANSQAIGGASSGKLPSSMAPGTSGLTTMTIGAYALTTFGPLPVFTPAAVGPAPTGTAVPRTHPQPLGNIGLGSPPPPPAFFAFPNSPLPLTMPTTATSSAATGRRETSNAFASVETQYQQLLRGTRGSIPGGANLWNWNLAGVPAFNGTGSTTGMTSGSPPGGGQSRYVPYRQPPPAHATSSSSSLSRRITNNFTTAANAGQVTGATNNANVTATDRPDASGTAAASRMYMHTPNMHEYQIQSEP